jgi:hypothetical protein
VREAHPQSLPTRDLVKELVSNGSLLVRRQLKLAELETRRQFSREKVMAELVGTGGGIAFAGVILLLVAAALGIGAALGDRFWLGALIVAGILFAIAGIVGVLGWSQRVQRPLGRTRRELNKELTWARTQLT